MTVHRKQTILAAEAFLASSVVPAGVYVTVDRFVDLLQVAKDQQDLMKKMSLNLSNSRKNGKQLQKCYNALKNNYDRIELLNIILSEYIRQHHEDPQSIVNKITEIIFGKADVVGKSKDQINYELRALSESSVFDHGETVKDK